MSEGLYVRWGKRFFDLVVACAMAPLLSPLLAAIALLVRVTSGRPVLFRQERAGLDGVPFTLLKFRTMINDAHELSGGYPSASMVTPVGRVLRGTSLDELPQLINVLRGEISFVGPRPALLDQVARYSDEQLERLQVRPGITGLAQIRFRNDAPWSVRIQADREYVRSVSFRMDVSILLKTIPAVVVRRGVKIGQDALEVDDLGGGAEDG